MKNQGQVFTTDMIFALILVAAFLSISSQAYDIASGQMKSYSTRYSLERMTNDTADILVKTAGDPIDWETHPSDLNTLGMAKLNPNNRPISNHIDSDKISKLAGEITGNNWKPNEDNADKEIVEFFGMNDSIENFEIRVVEKGKTIYHFWPGKESGDTPPSENASEVSIVSRIVYGRLIYVPGKSPPLMRSGAAAYENLEFFIYSGELTTYDWYLYIENLMEPQANWEVKVWINSTEGETSFHYKVKEMPKILPDAPGGIENDGNIADKYQLTEEEVNFIGLKLTGIPEEAFRVYVVGLPSGENRNQVANLLGKETYVFQLKLWR